MPKIGNSKSSKDLPCDRCGSKRKVSKKWTEKIKNASGYMVLEHVQIICTNSECQKEFEKKLLQEELKREKIKAARNVPSTSTKKPAVS